VLEPVPAGCTATGVPARIIGCVDVPEPALEMDQRI
jgi:serine O-acetyltransferase